MQYRRYVHYASVNLDETGGGGEWGDKKSTNSESVLNRNVP